MTEEFVRVSFIVIAYNQEAYVREACVAALNQHYPAMQVILSDDCSSDRTFEVMQEVAREYQGPHQLVLNQNPQNLGLIAHVNQCHALSSGELVVIAAGDDVSLPERTQTLVSAWLARGKTASTLHSSAVRINQLGEELGEWLPPIEEHPHTLTDLALSMSLIIGATHAWSREIFERFGPLTARGAYEDLVIAYRSALLGGIQFVPQALVRYRVDTGMSSQNVAAHRGRVARRAHVLRILRLTEAVYMQRLLDSEMAGRQDMVRVIQRGLHLAQLRSLVFGREAAVGTVFRFAVSHGLLLAALRAYLRRWRKF